MGAGRTTSAAAAEPQYSCEFGSSKYYALCGLGGVLSCGLTHTMVTPLDLVKCRLRVNKEKYKTLGNGFKLTVAEQGVRGLALGWAPTAIGYSMQGLCKFGFYEVFKNVYSGILGEENTYLYRTSLYLAASASAEFFADIALSPMESFKVRMQTSPLGTFPTTLREAAPKIFTQQGLNGFYKSLVPLWGRQIPYTMMKFACFERTVEAIYAYVVPKPRAECTKSEQLVVTFAAGYIAGVFCAIVSHPALQWFIYDGVKVALALPRPPPPAMPESLKKKLEARLTSTFFKYFEAGYIKIQLHLLFHLPISSHPHLKSVKQTPIVVAYERDHRKYIHSLVLTTVQEKKNIFIAQFLN